MTATFAKEPIVDRRLFQTSDLDEARHIVGRKFCDHRLEIRGDAHRFNAAHHRAEGQNTSLNFIRYGADVTIDPGELGSFYLVQIPLVGEANINNGKGEVKTGAGVGSVLNPHRSTQMRWHTGCAQLLLQIDATTLMNRAEHILGHHLNSPVTFETCVTSERTATENWIRRLKTCLNLTEKKALFGDSNRATQLLIEEELITEFLFSQPSDISHQLLNAKCASTSVLVRKAIRFIAEHLADPISIGDIATAAGVTSRRLQQAFRNELGQSPMHYVRLRRLHVARDRLSCAEEDMTISEICHRTGFNHQGRFSAEYRALFGEHPSETMRRQK